MRLLDTFSGIGGFPLAAVRAGIELASMDEIDPKCQKVLARHFPGVPIQGDIRGVSANDILGPIDIITGGFPCQDVSIAGRRAGLAGKRSGLWFEFLRLVQSIKPRWVVIENVPGLLSSHRGQDFATILSGLVGCGYSVSWRVLNAQHFGLAQHRRRLFIVASLGDGCATQVLFEPESGGGDIAPRQEVGREIAYAVTTQVRYSQGRDNLVPAYYTSTHQQDRIYDSSGLAPALAARLSGGSAKFVARAVATKSRLNPSHDNIVPTYAGLRRLTPREHERLQGFPDDWTAGHSDTTRYHMLGNAVPVPVVEWILRRIVDVDAI